MNMCYYDHKIFHISWSQLIACSGLIIFRQRKAKTTSHRKPFVVLNWKQVLKLFVLSSLETDWHRDSWCKHSKTRAVPI